MESISLWCTLLSQKPGFLCGIRRGCVGGSGSITCYNSKAIRLLGRLLQRQLSLQTWTWCPRMAADTRRWIPVTTSSLCQQHSDRLTAQHRGDAEVALTADWPGRETYSMCSRVLAANSHVRAQDHEVSIHQLTMKAKAIILTTANLPIDKVSFIFLHYPNCFSLKPAFASVKSSL